MTHGTSATERFAALLAESKPPTGGAALDALETEVRPVLPLLEELPVAERAKGDFSSFEFRECLTVLTLLGRRLALLDLTPTAALQIVDLALRAIEAADDPPTSAFRQRARTAVVEGFVRGREERVDQTAARRAAQPVRPLRVDASTFALIITGTHEPEVLTEHVDALGRAMLDADASTAIVDLSQLGEPSHERARAVFASDEIARMLGAHCVFSGVDPRWRAAAEDARIRLEELHLVRTFADAIEHASEAERARAAEPNPKWRGLLERLRGRG